MLVQHQSPHLEFHRQYWPILFRYASKIAIFHIFLHPFRFFNALCWFVYSKVHLIAVASLPNILWFYFLHSCEQLNNWTDVGAEENFRFSTSDLFHLFWSDDLQNLQVKMNHSLFERRDNLFPQCLKLSHVLCVSQLVWVHTSP